MQTRTLAEPDHRCFPPLTDVCIVIRQIQSPTPQKTRGKRSLRARAPSIFYYTSSSSMTPIFLLAKTVRRTLNMWKTMARMASRTNRMTIMMAMTTFRLTIVAVSSRLVSSLWSYFYSSDVLCFEWRDRGSKTMTRGVIVGGWM